MEANILYNSEPTKKKKKEEIFKIVFLTFLVVLYNRFLHQNRHKSLIWGKSKLTDEIQKGKLEDRKNQHQKKSCVERNSYKLTSFAQ